MMNSVSDVFIVDDDVSVRESLEALLNEEGFSARTFDCAESFLVNVRREWPSCVVLDVSLPGIDGLQVQQTLGTERPTVPIIFITGHGSIPMSVRAMKSGAVEFLTKPFREVVLIDAVRSAVESGRKSQSVETHMVALQARYAKLTPRERAVLPLIVSGLANKNVGFELGISEVTVKAHRGSLMKKLNANSFAALIQMAIRLRLIPDSISLAPATGLETMDRRFG